MKTKKHIELSKKAMEYLEATKTRKQKFEHDFGFIRKCGIEFNNSQRSE